MSFIILHEIHDVSVAMHKMILRPRRRQIIHPAFIVRPMGPIQFHVDRQLHFTELNVKRGDRNLWRCHASRECLIPFFALSQTRFPHVD